MAGRDITEGRGDSAGYARAIAVDVGIVSNTTTWTNTDVAYDVAIGGMPFIYAINDQRQYARQTAPFRKDQFDNGMNLASSLLLVGGFAVSHPSMLEMVSDSMTLPVARTTTTDLQIARVWMYGLRDRSRFFRQ